MKFFRHVGAGFALPFFTGRARAGQVLPLRIISALALAWLCIPLPVSAGDFDAANQACASKKYDEAIRLYENLLRGGRQSAAVYYNLGNVHYLKGEVGPAVLNYQRALLLEPNSADATANLAALRQAHDLPAPAVTPWLRPLLVFSLNAWSWLALAALLTAMLAVFLRAAWLNFYRREECPHRWFHGVAAAGALAMLVAVGGVWAQGAQANRQVVMTGGAALLVSPFADAGAIGGLREGELVTPLKRSHQDFVYVKNSAGQKGWVSAGKLQPVLE
jgi:hypothetical protein